jgi:hypothetical protein
VNEATLRDLARRHLSTGKLPNIEPRRVWGGPGIGVECSVCELPVGADQSEMQIEFSRDHVPILDIFHFHIRCFAVWELERNNAQSP